MTVSEEMALLAELLDVPQPRRIPYAIARASAGGAARMLTVSHRVSAGTFRTATGWEPAVASAREGWQQVISNRVQTT